MLNYVEVSQQKTIGCQMSSHIAQIILSSQTTGYNRLAIWSQLSQLSESAHCFQTE